MQRARCFILTSVIIGSCLMLLSLTGCAPKPQPLGKVTPASHWQVLRMSNPGPNKPFDIYTGIYPLSPTTGFIFGTFAPTDTTATDAKTVPLQTTDSGATWQQIDQPIDLMDFSDDKVVWTLKNDNDSLTAQQTKDGGTTWTGNSFTIGNLSCLSLAATSEKEAWVTARGFDDKWSRLLHTTDSGTTWQSVSYPRKVVDEPGRELDMEFVRFRDPAHGVAVLSVITPNVKEQDETFNQIEYRRLFLTTDGGKSFVPALASRIYSEETPPPYIGQLVDFPNYQLHFIDDQHAWLAFGGKYLLRTADGGDSWQKLTPMVNGKLIDQYLLDVSFINSREGWAVGTGGLAIHTTDGGLTWQSIPTGVEKLPAVILTRVAFIDSQHGWVAGQAGGGSSGVAVTPIGGTAERNDQNGLGFLLKYVP